jgi:hypothetical protein
VVALMGVFWRLENRTERKEVEKREK